MDRDKERAHLISLNLQHFLNAHGIKQVDLAKAVGVSPATINDYIKERGTPSFGTIQRIANYFGVKKSDIDSIYKEDKDSVTDTYRLFNYIDSSISAGLPSNVDPFTSDDMKKIPVAEESLGRYKNADDLLMVKVAGDSMNRVFPDKSLIGVKKIDSIKDLKDGDIVVFSDSGDFCVKRIYINPKLKLVIFTPDSTDKNFFPITYQFSNMEEIKIWGKVVVYTVTIE